MRLSVIKKFFLLFIILYVSILSSCTSHPPVHEKKPELLKLEAKVLTEQPFILDHGYFLVNYDKQFRLARYVKYKITSEQLKISNKAKRSNKFKIDPKLDKAFAVKPSEYIGTGYDQGHLANSKDFGFSQEAQDTTFLMSNMAPQKPNLNRDAWLKLENQVRMWACGEETIKIITGPILNENLQKKGSLVIPEEFFKVVLDETPPKKMLAFIYFQTDKGDVIKKRLINNIKFSEKILPRIKEENIDLISYPMEPLTSWKSTNCFTKSKNSKE